jgi:GNAT superfamily N-acetyltransferase
MDDPSYQWRGPFADADVNALHAEGFGHPVLATGWREQVERHSLGWVCAHDADRLVGFVNVAWDGGVHAFVVDTVVAAGARHRGIGVGLLDVARREARAAGCEWLHVDFEEEQRGFYLGACGFAPTPAGVIALASRSAQLADATPTTGLLRTVPPSDPKKLASP